ncbi:Putative phosphatase [Herminiimonas arsenicoxydans]|uniref:Phosphatase n=1 Tax=Herminiimonas arsenicoxydans TaxID=204773 RepID=A4G6V1_HERAR|nr:Putative phosphatase [Herminiimonas arsenicoxydans]
MNEQSEFKVRGAPSGFALGLGVAAVSHAKARTGLKILLGFIFPLILFFALATDIGHGKIYPFDHSFLLMLHAHATPFLDRWALGISAVISVFSFLVLIYLCCRRLWHTALFWLLAVGGSSVLNFIAKNVIQRSRPDLWALVSPQSNFSFPSGHTTEAMAIAVAMVVLLHASRYIRAIWMAVCAFVLLVALCRMYLGLHYLSDIVGSCLLALTWVVGLSILFDVYGRTSQGSPVLWLDR